MYGGEKTKCWPYLFTYLCSMPSTQHVLARVLGACALSLCRNFENFLKLILELVLTENYEPPSSLPGSSPEAV